MQASAVASLSGGWKMKLALARAMLMKADILLLDEPTNHLDVTNVAWLENYLVSFPSFFFSLDERGKSEKKPRLTKNKNKKKLTPPPLPQKKKKKLQGSLTDVTSMIVSHDSGFLDNVCTHIIHYENRKLRRYKGNLSEFVKQVRYIIPFPGFSLHSFFVLFFLSSFSSSFAHSHSLFPSLFLFVPPK